MKIGNVILAIFLWLCIPATFVFGLFAGVLGGGAGGGALCGVGAPLILFILGLVSLITGMEKSTSRPDKQSFIEKHNYELEDVSKKEKDNKVDMQEKKTNFCSKCGEQFKGDEKFCSNCSAKRR